MARFSSLAEWILDHPRLILVVVSAVTLYLGYWAFQVKTDHKTGTFLQDESKAVRDLLRAGEVFGQSQTVMYVVFQEADPYDARFLSRLDSTVRLISTWEGVESVLALSNVPFLVRENKEIAAYPLYNRDDPPDEIRKRLSNQPFLRGLLLSDDGTTPAMLVKFDKAFNDTKYRVAAVQRIEALLEDNLGKVALTGFPYLRSQYAQRVTSEAPLFTLLAAVVSLAILFLTFRARRAITLPTIIVALGIIWTIGIVARSGHALNVVTSILPALLVIIGMANAIHLSTKFFDRYQLLGDKRRALMQSIKIIGVATLLTSLTTAVGFFVLTLSGSRVLEVFGIFAGIGILLLYVLTMTIIPVIYIMIRPPSDHRPRLATHDGLDRLFDTIAVYSRAHSRGILASTGIIVLVGVVGSFLITTDIFVYGDFSERDPVRKSVTVFEESFGGALPLDVVIESRNPGKFRSLTWMRRLERLQADLDSIPAFGRSLSVVDLIKLSNQAYFGGKPAAYRLPSAYELPFLRTALAGFVSHQHKNDLIDNVPGLVDSTFSMTRILLGVSDIGTTEINHLEREIDQLARQYFPEDAFDVFVTGTAITSTRSGENLVNNLIRSLAVALVVISIMMALLFRSSRLTVISMIPNLVPLVVVGGAMGFAGIILKPSTALIFPLAFGIAVDDSIHFLAKYRFLKAIGLARDAAIRTTMRETGKAILFTSLVLMGGFLVFTLSSFGGTVNLGALTALTLAVALVTNLVLLPALLFRYAPLHDADVSANGRGRTPENGRPDPPRDGTAHVSLGKHERSN